MPNKAPKAKKETAKKMTSAPEKALTKAPKLAKVVAKATVALTKKAGKPTLAAKALKAIKGDKKSEKIELKATELPTGEKSEDEEDEIADAGGTAPQAGMALAAATAETAAGSLKNFRHHPDIENFYRFIFENDLRYEALEFIDVIASQREVVKKTAKAGKSKH